ncbi:MAG TPA: hypothetical protein VLU46_00795 [Thermoanaerobaculia bacterium]|nr:hypothetical protein [Thermoanaerobaculia bacterium]
MKRVALVVAVVLATHLTYEYSSNGDFYFPDSVTYLAPALNLLHGNGFTTDENPETLRTPGYPLFLVPFLAAHAASWFIVFVQHLLVALLAAAIYLRTRNAVGPLVLAFDLITIHFANKILTETLSAVVLFAIFCGAARFSAPDGGLKAAATLGLLCGTLVLIRPVAIAYFCVVMLWLVFVRVRPRAVVMFVIAALVLPLGWAARNQIETGHFTVSPVGAVNLLMQRAAGALAMEDGGDFDAAHEKRMAELQKIVDARIKEGEEEDPDDVNSADVAPYYTALARPIIVEHWRGTILVTLRGFFVNMFDTDWEALRIVTTVPGPIVRIAANIWTWMLWIATIAGLAMLWRRHRAQALLIAATIVYFLFMAAGGEAEGRFRAPLIPLMAYAIAYAF